MRAFRNIIYYIKCLNFVARYYIFNDVQMEELIEQNPKDEEDVCQVSGFGKNKVEKYGKEIIEILRRE